MERYYTEYEKVVAGCTLNKTRRKKTICRFVQSILYSNLGRRDHNPPCRRRRTTKWSKGCFDRSQLALRCWLRVEFLNFVYFFAQLLPFYICTILNAMPSYKQKCAFPRVSHQTRNTCGVLIHSTPLTGVWISFPHSMFLHFIAASNILFSAVFSTLSVFHKIRAVEFMIVSNVFRKNCHVYFLCVSNFVFRFIVSPTSL